MSAFVAILSTGDNFWLMLSRESDKSFAILGWEDVNRGLYYFQEGYRQKHRQSYEGSMSACINFIQFQPRIVEFADMADLEARLLPTKLPDAPTADQAVAALLATPHADAVNRRPCRLSSISGFYDVLPLVPDIARPLWEKGVSPALI